MGVARRIIAIFGDSEFIKNLGDKNSQIMAISGMIMAINGEKWRILATVNTRILSISDAVFFAIKYEWIYTS